MSVYAAKARDPDREINQAFKRAVIYSAGAHLVLILAMTIGAWASSARPGKATKTPYGNSIQVGLYSAPPIIEPAPQKTEAAKPEKPKTTEPTKPPPATPKPEPPKPEPAKPATIPKPEPKKEPEKKPEPPKKPEPAKKPEPTKPAPAKPAPADNRLEPPPSLPDDKARDVADAREAMRRTGDPGPPGRPGSPSGSGEEFDEIMEIIERDVRMKFYQGDVGSQFSLYWKPPPSVPAYQGLRVDVLLIVDNQGNVKDYEIVYRSGNADLDRSVETVLKTIRKLPPPPRPAPDNRTIIPLRFRPDEF